MGGCRSPRPCQPPFTGAPFSVAVARAHGLPLQRLRRTDTLPTFHGARAAREPETLAEFARALHPLLADHERFSHLTAAALLGLRMPQGYRSTVLHLTSAGAQRARRRPGVVGHKGGAGASTQVLPNGVRVSSPVLAWCECAALLDLEDLIVMGDGLICRTRPVATMAELAAAVAAWGGRRSARNLRAALVELRPGTDSARETTLRRRVIALGLPEPVVNAEIKDVGGAVVAHGDLVWPQFRLVAEYEGRQHWEDDRQFAIDIDRHHRIAEAGYRILRIDKHLLRDERRLAALLSSALRAGGWNPTAPRGRNMP